ncbi:TrlF family AAA-like ATPase [Gelidibacter sp.]|uniref:TrlF family AAA-like ATPase n=1 Tax=Gelidibacter sp. TaxID=2018083 RepID=UPI0032650B4F
MKEIDYKGSRWFKCDLHLHTTASKCFEDQTVTPQQWVERAIEQGLNCVAVTDHNTGASVDEIKEAAKDTALTIFPGVEITCDASKVHLLIIFDTTKTTADIRDFLVRANIRAEDFGKQEAATISSIFEISELAIKDGALVIPAHIDEYNGLGSVSVGNLKKLYSEFDINAVQVVHKEFLDLALQTTCNLELKEKLNDYYNNPTPAIEDSTIKEWYTPVKYALEAKKAVVTFSDNPHAPKNSKHGLDGIGTRFTWIKMGDTPSLEGLRQAFLLPDFRIKNDFDSPNLPYNLPDLWIKSITVSNSTITKDNVPLKIDFNPQLTTIIGGRGSGKSSVLRFIRGLFNRTNDLADLTEILEDHNHFYKNFDTRTQKGVLKENTSIEIEFIRNSIIYKIISSAISNSANQTIIIQKYDSEEDAWVLEEAESFIDFFQYEHYSQKQIYEIAKEPNSLRERIDKSISGMGTLVNEREVIKKEFLEKSAAIRTIRQQISGKGKLQTEISDLDAQIKLLQQSGIASLLTLKNNFTSQKKTIDEFLQEAKNNEEEIESLSNTLKIEEIHFSEFDNKYSVEISTLGKIVIDGYEEIKREIEASKRKAEKLRADFNTSLPLTNWSKDFDQNNLDFTAKKIELETQGIDDISNYEKLSDAKKSKELELEKIVTIEQSLKTEIAGREILKTQFLQKAKEITVLRIGFIGDLMQDDKVKVSIKQFRNKTDFVNKVRAITQRLTGFETDIDSLVDICFNGNVENKIKDVRELFLKIRNEEVVTGVSGYFVNLVKGMSESQIDEIELLIPEDEIDVQYKPSGSSTFRPLSTASAGQKTTAILTFILSQGNIPLILDQPEDDLDNRLVYELIVDRLKQAKENRQIIVVTHNANIPVNGDAEYILSMDSESRSLEVLYSGTVEEPTIKKEICDVMEGSEKAFNMRSER